MGREIAHILQLRRAKESDEALLLLWRNEEAVRKNSFQQDKVDEESHRSWFQRKCQDENCIFLILEKDGMPAAQVRIEIEDMIGWVNYSVAQEYRGQGLGRILLEKMEQEVVSTEITCLKAQVKPENEASSKCFLRLGYQLEEQNETYWQYTKGVTDVFYQGRRK